MQITSIEFLIFFLTVLGIYYLCPPRGRYLVLLAAGCCFTGHRITDVFLC